MSIFCGFVGFFIIFELFLMTVFLTVFNITFFHSLGNVNTLNRLTKNLPLLAVLSSFRNIQKVYTVFIINIK